MISIKLKTKIKMLCVERGITITQIERDLGMNSHTLTRWDKNVPNVASVKDVADYLGVTVDYLLE